MCGIAGIVDLRYQRAVDPNVLARMARALTHRGPDEEGFSQHLGVGLASRRLSIVGIEDSQQPFFSENGMVVAVFNGELFDYVENRSELVRRGHAFCTSGDGETLVHLWEDHGEQFFSHVNGQFAFALLDRRRRQLILARDRVGICPLHWAQTADWLLFGSEIKALLASKLIKAAADPYGLSHLLTFFGLPSRRTTFRGISAIPPGHYLKVSWDRHGELAEVRQHRYWDFEFPDQGSEYDPPQEEPLVDELESVLQRAIRIRMRADVPVASYLSGGVDSATVIAMAQRLKCPPVTTFTAQVDHRHLNEGPEASSTARWLKCEQQVVHANTEFLSSIYPRMVLAADAPVVDPNSGTLFALSGAVQQAGLKTALTGEGADEALAGYVWFKIHKVAHRLGWRSFKPAVQLFDLAFRIRFPRWPHDEFQRINDSVGGLHAHTLFLHMMGVARWVLLSPDFHEKLARHRVYDDLELDLQRMRDWHPLNQSLYFGYKTMLPGLLLGQRGDRPAMANSVELRYPFLDERVIDVCGKIHPRWKLRGVRQEKYLLRRLAVRYLPPDIAYRPKVMFRAPFQETFFPCTQPYVRQLLSRQSLRRTPYFDADRVLRFVERFQNPQRRHPPHRYFESVALTMVLATQLWHHCYLGGQLCELPTWSAPTVDSVPTDTMLRPVALGEPN